MTVTIILLVIGIGLLYAGAEVLVGSASGLALRIGIRPLIIGFTIIAMGTSSPELAVSLLSAIQGTKDIALGNIIGSNIANIGLVIGVAAIVRPLTIRINTIRREMPYLIAATVIFYLLSLDGVIGFFDGLFLFCGFIVFIMYMIRLAQKDRKKDKEFFDGIGSKKKGRPILIELFLILLGLAGLVGGSTLMVNSARVIALNFGISEIVIGITLVAVGTSLPELAISTVGALKGEVDLAVGNAVGSNLFNILFVIAIVAMIYPIPVESGLLKFDYLFMLGLSVIFLPMMIFQFKITRMEGVILLLLYAVFIWLVFKP
ncbi:calcium/sodium antiporter [candidate division KSB1 bacterium]|nr:calcium/sodium antiporter [candidate division KSB1 bacterium]